MTAHRGGGAQRQTSMPPLSVVATSVHRDDMADARSPRGVSPVHRHSEVVAVRHSDLVTTEQGFEPTQAGEGYGTVELEGFDGDSGTDKLVGKPALTARRDHDQDFASGGLKLSRHARQHPLRAARAVRLDEVRHVETAQPVQRPLTHLPNPWRKLRPAAQARYAGSRIPAGTLTLGRAHGSTPGRTKP